MSTERLRGKRVVVTGGSRGIGAAIVRACAAEGMQVLAVARKFDPGFAGGPVQTIICDLLDREQRAKLVASAVERLGGIDAWVNNAGIARHGNLADISEADLAAQFEVNFFAPLELSKQVLPHLAVVQGSLVNVLSSLAIRPAAGKGAYAASKAALLSATRTLALEAAKDGVRINAVAPGFTDTDMIADRSKDPVLRAQMEGLSLLGRIGRPEEIAHGVVYLLRSEWATGTVLAIDGGLVAS